MSNSLPFVKQVVEECSLFFYTMHRFCNSYVDKLNKRMGNTKTLNYRKKSQDMLKFSRSEAGARAPNPKPPSPYILYVKDQTKLLKAKQEFVAYDGKKLNKFIAKKWRMLNPEEKQVYRDRWEKLRVVKDISEEEKSEIEYSDPKDEKDNDEDHDNNDDIDDISDDRRLKEPTIQLLAGSQSSESRRKKITKNKNKNGPVIGANALKATFGALKRSLNGPNSIFPDFDESSIRNVKKKKTEGR